MIQYLEDVPLPDPAEPEEGWPPEAFLDPLHPAHGPVPQLCGLLDSEAGHFVVAAWDDGRSIVTLLEWSRDEGPDDEPMLPIEAAHCIRGWIAQTYRWCPDGDTMECSGLHVILPDYPGEKRKEAWQTEIYHRIMRASVRLAMDGPATNHGSQPFQ
jgi:hypothetical protein